MKNVFWGRWDKRKHEGSSHGALSLYLLTVLLFAALFFSDGKKAKAAELSPAGEEAPCIVVIDPGHGGENLGAEYDGYTEKDMTMVVARAMKEELEQYDNVVVYLTRETDADMTIRDRADFANDKHADFLVCLHFNSSVNHNLYGAEVWVPAFDNLYTQGRQFAEIEMALLTEKGLYSRGIKTRLNEEGDNYYGILRYCSEYNIPSALVEHCHLDQDRDKPFYQQGEEQLKELGRLDAEAVARYLRLSSPAKGVDYSDYPLPEPVIPAAGVVEPDKTPPEICELEAVSVDREKAQVTFTIRGRDSDSFIMYYDYSIDGGGSYSELMDWSRPEWNQSDEEMQVTIDVPYDREIQLTVSVYNGFDVWSDSRIVEIPAIPGPTPESETSQAPTDPQAAPLSGQEENALSGDGQTEDDWQTAYEEERGETKEVWEAKTGNETNAGKVLLIVLILALSLCLALLLVVFVKLCFRLRGHNRKRKRR